MRFIAITKPAAEAMASDRFLQSCEYLQGDQLALMLRGCSTEVFSWPRFSSIYVKDGLYLLSSTETTGGGLLVIDLEASHLFSDVSSDTALLFLQKILRFCLRYWNNQKFTVSERIIPNSTKAVVFPFPISAQTSFRIGIERSPDDRRLAKRPSVGKCLLVYRAATDEGLGSAEIPDVTVFRKALSGLDEARQKVSAIVKPASTPSITAISLTRLDPMASSIDGYIGFDNWMRQLTNPQKAFVEAELRSPHRIEGPAGTGKTICLILKAIDTLRRAQRDGIEHRSLFIAHSEATRRTIQDLFNANDEHGFSHADRYSSVCSMTVTTLHELCGKLLQTEIAESEFLDRDAMESKNTQLLYVEEALGECLAEELSTYRKFLSPAFLHFLETEDEWAMAQMVQYEISVIIKGRSNESLDDYKSVLRPDSALPLNNDADRGLVFAVFSRYQDKLRAVSQFDTDDVVLSALGPLNTPVWRRRRGREGFDSIFIDESHLFNLNELSVFHHLTRREGAFPIAYSADPSQSLQDRGWSGELFDRALFDSSEAKMPSVVTAMKSVFRCAPEIVNLALSVTSSGATLFTNFEDPIGMATSAFTEEEERLSERPIYKLYANDEEMTKAAFAEAERLADELGGKSKIAIVVFEDALFEVVRRYSESMNKPVEIMRERGDIDVVQRAQRSGRFVLSTPEYVGGLEFNGAVLVGVDEGRVPPSQVLANSGSSAFLSYMAHSRLYVAITRARFRVRVLGNSARGPSRLLQSALESEILIQE